jgi:hypothetical protein
MGVELAENPIDWEHFFFDFTIAIAEFGETVV